MGYFQVRYDSRVVIYKHKMFIRLATENTMADHLFILFGFIGFVNVELASSL